MNMYMTALRGLIPLSCEKQLSLIPSYNMAGSCTETRFDSFGTSKIESQYGDQNKKIGLITKLSKIIEKRIPKSKEVYK